MDHRTVKALVRKATEKQKRAAELLADPDKTIQAAMIEAGYSPKQARKGYAGVSKTVLAMLPKSVHFVEIGKAITTDVQEAAIRGRLFANVVNGEDKGVVSCYRLGQDKRVNMFQAENQVGVILVQAPETFVRQSAIPDDVDPPSNTIQSK